MKVKEILIKYGVYNQYHPLINDTINGGWIEDTNKLCERVTNCHADIRRLLESNYETQLEQYLMFGPIATFAFRIRGGDMAIFVIDSLCDGYKIQRIQRGRDDDTEKFDEVMALLKVEKVTSHMSDAFMTWQTLKTISGGEK